jgi:hypothetical protein
MNNQIDHLSDFENEHRKVGTLFVLYTCICCSVVICAVLYFLWLFKKPAFELIRDSEFQLLFSIHFIYPLIGLYLFITKRKIGWVLMVLFSILNVTYAIVAYVSELAVDIAVLYFIGQAILIALLFQKPLIANFNMSRKFFLSASYSSIAVAGLLLIFMLVTYM